MSVTVPGLASFRSGASTTGRRGEAAKAPDDGSGADRV
jgi:hypothetical protein